MRSTFRTFDSSTEPGNVSDRHRNTDSLDEVAIAVSSLSQEDISEISASLADTDSWSLDDVGCEDSLAAACF